MDFMSISDQWIRATLDFFRRTLDKNFFTTQEENFERAAAWAAPLSAVLGLLFSLVAAIKGDSFRIFLLGIVWVFVVCIGYFIGKQFLAACRKMILNNPSTISSGAFLETVGLLLVVTLFAVVAGSLYLSIETSTVEPLLAGLFASVAIAYSICLVFNPSLISTSISAESTAGDDALAIMVVFYKMAVRLTGIVFGSSLVVGSLLLVTSIFKLLDGDVSEMIGGGLQSLTGALFTVGGLAYPFGIYITFVFFYLFIDICRAILSLHNRQAPSAQPAPPADDDAPGADGSGVSPEMMKRVLVIALGVVVLAVVGMKGKQYYEEYRERAAIEQAQEEQAALAAEQAKQEEAARLAAEQEQKRAAAAAEAERVAFAAAVQPYVGKSSLDLVRAPGVNELFREIFGGQYDSFEGLLGKPQAVTSAEGFLLAPGCSATDCVNDKALAVVDVQQRKVFAITSSYGQLTLHGIESEALPAAVTNWVSANW